MSARIRLAIVMVVSFAMVTAACQRREDTQPTEPTTAEEEPEHEAPEEDEQIAKSSEIPGTQNQLEWDQNVPEVEFEITSPREGQTLESGDEVAVEFDLSNYRIGKEIGQHIHFIVDNEPYIAHYAEEPLILEDLEPGTHTIRAFPSRHYHLSLKEDGAFDTRIFHVEEESGEDEFTFDPNEPYITYSRPKGEYSAEGAQELLLDFYVSNIELGDDARVVYEVAGHRRRLDEWQPVLMPPLEPGEHDVRLRLVDGDGNQIENGGYNDTTRTITVTDE